ncbi:MAG: dockerin type I repeat-containing protein [Candidatus Cloacimonetes bacterium]|nr:dockerin type I repeat-containing protein [Candidatus Cloacimonadota bacterium]
MLNSLKPFHKKLNFILGIVLFLFNEVLTDTIKENNPFLSRNHLSVFQSIKAEISKPKPIILTDGSYLILPLEVSDRFFPDEPGSYYLASFFSEKYSETTTELGFIDGINLFKPVLLNDYSKKLLSSDITIDKCTNNPFIIWASPALRSEKTDIMVSLDKFHLLNSPGLLEQPFRLFSTDCKSDELVIKTKIGPAPVEGKRRLYILINQTIDSAHCGLLRLFYRDFEFTEEIFIDNSQSMSFPLIEQTQRNYHNNWTEASINSREESKELFIMKDFNVSVSGKLAITGFQKNRAGKYEFAFLTNSLFGKGKWTKHIYDSEMILSNQENSNSKNSIAATPENRYDFRSSFDSRNNLHLICPFTTDSLPFHIFVNHICFSENEKNSFVNQNIFSLEASYKLSFNDSNSSLGGTSYLTTSGNWIMASFNSFTNSDSELNFNYPILFCSEDYGETWKLLNFSDDQNLALSKIDFIALSDRLFHNGSRNAGILGLTAGQIFQKNGEMFSDSIASIEISVNLSDENDFSNRGFSYLWQDTFWGDVDFNNRIDENDAVLILNHSAGIVTGEDFGKISRSNRADLDQNGKIQALDAGIILNYNENWINELPVVYRPGISSASVYASYEEGFISLFYDGFLMGLELKIPTKYVEIDSPIILDNSFLSVFQNDSSEFKMSLCNTGVDPEKFLSEDEDELIPLLKIPLTAVIPYKLEIDLTVNSQKETLPITVLPAQNIESDHLEDVLSIYSDYSKNQTGIIFSITEDSYVKLFIENSKGIEISRQIDSYLEKGEYSIIWNNTENADLLMESGIYTCVLKTENIELKRKFVILK